jgi:hypothetical protein
VILRILDLLRILVLAVEVEVEVEIKGGIKDDLDLVLEGEEGEEVLVQDEEVEAQVGVVEEEEEILLLREEIPDLIRRIGNRELFRKRRRKNRLLERELII